MKHNRQYFKTISLMLVIMTALLSGCIGVGMRNIMTQERPYEKFVKEMPPIPIGFGRIFIYSPEGGPSYPLNSIGDIDFFTIDKKVYRFGGASYFYLDIQSGSHPLTVTNVLIRGFASNKKQYGKHRLELKVNNQQSIYLRFVNQNKSKAIDERAYSVNIVDKESAELEMASLDFWDNHQTTMEIVQ